MKKTIVFLSFFFPFLLLAQWTQIGSDIYGTAVGDLAGERKSVSLNSAGNRVAIGSYYADDNGSNSGHVRVFDNIAGVWTQIGSTISGEAAYNQFGTVAISGDGTTLVVGEKFSDASGFNSGQVKVFQFIGGDWIRIGNVLEGEAAEDEFGHAVSINEDGSIIAIGAYRNDGNGSDSGHVRVFENISGTWTQIGADIDGEDFNYRFGNAVSLSSDGSILAVGATSAIQSTGIAPMATGHVKIYQNTGGTWTQLGNTIEGENVGESFGVTVSLSNDGTIIGIGGGLFDDVGPPYVTDRGRATVYEYNSSFNLWSQVGDDILGENAGDTLGIAVSISGNGEIIAVGAPSYDHTSGSGQVKVFIKNGNNWIQSGSDIYGGSASGRSVSLSDNGAILAIGAPNYDGNGSSSGQVRIFESALLHIVENGFDNAVKMYPNPTTNQVTIDLGLSYELVTVAFYDTLGKEVLKKQFSQTSTMEVDVSFLNQGIYIAKIKSNNKETSLKVIVE